jgi:hypothetical protein
VKNARVTDDWNGDKMERSEPVLPMGPADMSTTQLPPIVPIEYAGKWIAWDFKETKIIANGLSYEEAKKKAETTGERRPVLEKVPDAKVRFIGGHR